MSSFYQKIRPRIRLWFYQYPLIVAGSALSLMILGLLWLISPLVKIKICALTAQRLGHLSQNTDLFFRRRQLFGLPPRTRYIFLAGSVANRQLFQMWKRHITIIESRFLRGLFHYSQSLWRETSYYEDIEIKNNEYKEYQTTHPTLSFTDAEEEKGRQGLRQMGINPDKDWFVCVFARDPEYLKKEFGHQKDWSYHDYRNSDINTYRLAIDYLISRGGFVVRLGYHVGQALDYSHKQVIDYAVKYRSDFMDIYLTAKCKFLLGNGSGICDVVLVFDTPRIQVNTAPPVQAPCGKHGLFIPKKIRVRKTGEPLPYATFIAQTVDIRNPILWYSQALHQAGYEYENNTPEEIRDVTIEMMERLDGTFQQTDEDRTLLENYSHLFPSDHYMACVKTPMGRNFLRNNKELFYPQKN